MSVVDVAIWVAGAAALFALIYVHRRAVVPAASVPVTTLPAAPAPAKAAAPVAKTSPSLLADGEAAVDTLIAQIEADAKAWEAHAAQVTTLKAKVAAVKVPTPVVTSATVAGMAPAVVVVPAAPVA